MSVATELDTDVIVVGAGPTGLMLAGELGLASVRTTVLERHPHIRETPKAGGLSGQIVELLHYRGVLERFEAASTRPVPALRLPFGGLHIDFTPLDVPPMRLLLLPQQKIERVLDERASELGADVRRGHDVAGISQDTEMVSVAVRGPDGPYEMTARYLVGCDGAYSRVREVAGIPFPGTTYPEVNRLVQVTKPESVTVLENGDIDVAGAGTIKFGFTTTEHGIFAVGSSTPGVLGLFTCEDETASYDDDEPMTLAEVRDSIRRVLGIDIPLGEPIRMTRFTFHARHVERYRNGRIFVAGDAAHLFPAPGVALGAGMMDSVNLGWKLAGTIHGWAPAGLLDTYHDERHLAGERTMLHTQAQVALRRGYDAAAEALRKLIGELLTDREPLRRIGDFIAGTDDGTRTPGSNDHPLAGAFVPDLRLHIDRNASSVARLMHGARPLFLDLADRRDLRDVLRPWRHRMDIHIAQTDGRPADALLVRPDARVAWAAAFDESGATAIPALRKALLEWFGT